MHFFRENKTYILILAIVLVLIAAVVGYLYHYYPVPLGLTPRSITVTRIISDEGAKQSCDIQPFSQKLLPGQESYFQVNLQPSYQDSWYYLEAGDLPRGVHVQFDSPEGRGDKPQSFSVVRASDSEIGSFTLTIAYHEWQGYKWLVNYCLFNIVLPKSDGKI